MANERSKTAKEQPNFWDLVGCVVVLPLMFVAALLAPLWLAVFWVVVRHNQSKHRSRMAMRGRFMPWDEVETHLKSDRGTLIVEMVNKLGARVWWTDERVRMLYTDGVPTPDELDYVVPQHIDPERMKFYRWCHQRYIDSESGRGLLTLPPSNAWRKGFDHVFREMFPEAAIVETLRLATVKAEFGPPNN